ncbi:TRAP transporter substrate-binding protein [Chloroflexota bacterium]
MNRSVKMIIFCSLSVILVLGLVLAGCTQKPASPTQQPVKLRYSTTELGTENIGMKQRWFADEVAKRTNGLVTIELYTGGELYGHNQVVEAVSTGGIEMGFTSGGWVGRTNPLHGFYNYFFLLSTLEQYEKAKDELASILFPLTEPVGLKTVNWFGKGESMYFGTKPLVNPEDMKGMMLRGPNKQANSCIEILGGVPASVSLKEVYDVMSKGGLDGAFSNWNIVYSRKWYEVSSYFTGPFWTATWYSFMNLDTWNSLSPDIQKTIMDVGREAENQSFKESVSYDKEAIEALKKVGTVTIFTPEQEAKWGQFVRPAQEQWVKDCEEKGYGSQAQEILKILAKYR